MKLTDNAIKKLFNAFPSAFINHNFEFIAHREANLYFRLEDCETELDIQCKVIEWFSRAAYKSTPFRSDKKNNEYHAEILSGINDYLGTSFGVGDIERVYTYLGNCCNHKLTIEFIKSGYDVGLLRRD